MSLIISRDNYNQITPPEYILRKASKEREGVLKCTNKTYDHNLNELDSISFSIPLYINGHERNDYYDDIDIMKYIEVENIGVFYIKNIEINSEGTYEETKDVTCDSYEGLLGQKYLESFIVYPSDVPEELLEDEDEGALFGVKFYNPADPSHSLLHLVFDKCPEWSFGYIEPSLWELGNYYDIDRKSIYDFLMEDVADGANCIFIFDTLNLTVNAYNADTFSRDSNIFVSYDNLLKNTTISYNVDDIKTCLTVLGADELNLREINLGFMELYNFDYYLNTKYMSQELIDGITAWRNIYEENVEVYHDLLVERAKISKQIYEINIEQPTDQHWQDWGNYDEDDGYEYTEAQIKAELKTYGYDIDEDNSVNSPLGLILNSYNELKVAHENSGDYNKETVEVTVDQVSPTYIWYINSSGERTQTTVPYINTVTFSSELYTRISQIIEWTQEEINRRTIEIERLVDQVRDYDERLAEVAAIADLRNNISREEFNELSSFIREDELTTDLFAIYDSYTEEDIEDELRRMLEYAQKELAKKSVPQLTFSASILNLYQIPEFNNYTGNFDIGNYVHVAIRDDYYIKTRLLNIHFNFYDPTDFTLTFANIALKEKNVFTDIQDAINTATDAATSVSFGSGAWYKASKTASDINQILSDGLIDAQKYITGTTDTSEMVIDQRGIFVNTTQGQYKDSIYIGGGRILFSPDGWEHVSEAIGRVNVEGESIFGVLADAVIAGRIYGSTLKGNDIIGGVLVSNNYVSGKYGTYMSLVDGTFEFNNAGKQLLTLDSNGNLTVTGKIQATSGYIGNSSSGLTITSSGMYTGSHSSLDSTNDGIYIWSDGISIGSKFKVAKNGTLTATDGNFTGKITGGSININDKFVVDSLGNMTASSAKITGGSITIGSNFSVDSSGNLTAKGNANISGTITSSNATLSGGSIAGWSFNSQSLTSGLISLNSATASIYIGNTTLRNITAAHGRVNFLDIIGDVNFSGDLFFENGFVSDGTSYLNKIYTNSVEPNADNTYVCGTAENAWVRCRSYNFITKTASSTSSDRKLKTDIKPLDEKYEELFFKLRPTSYRFKDGERTHIGAIAQEVEQAVSDCGLTSMDFAGYTVESKLDSENDEADTSNLSDEEKNYYLRYPEFVMLNTHMIQKLYKRVDELEQEIEGIKNA